MAGKFEDANFDLLKPFFKFLADDLVKQRKRIGGDWAIAQAIFSRDQRDFFRKEIGPDLVFIVLNMTKSCQEKRVKARHGDSLGDHFLDLLVKYAELCEPAGDDEENAYNLTITEEMSREDVLQKCLEIVQKL